MCTNVFFILNMNVTIIFPNKRLNKNTVLTHNLKMGKDTSQCKDGWTENQLNPFLFRDNLGSSDMDVLIGNPQISV